MFSVNVFCAFLRLRYQREMGEIFFKSFQSWTRIDLQYGGHRNLSKQTKLAYYCTIRVIHSGECIQDADERPH